MGEANRTEEAGKLTAEQITQMQRAEQAKLMQIAKMSELEAVMINGIFTMQTDMGIRAVFVDAPLRGAEHARFAMIVTTGTARQFGEALVKLADAMDNNVHVEEQHNSPPAPQTVN